MRKFIKEILSSSSNASSKRLAGLSGWYCFLALVAGAVAFDLEINSTQESLIKTIATTSTVLLTTAAVVGAIKNKQK